MSGIKHRRLFYINTADKISGTDASNFQIQIPIPPHETFTHVCVLEANIPKSYYLVQSGFNTFTLRENGVNSTITIPAGNYSLSSFATVLATQLNATTSQGWTYTVSY